MSTSQQKFELSNKCLLNIDFMLLHTTLLATKLCTGHYLEIIIWQRYFARSDCFLSGLDFPLRTIVNDRPPCTQNQMLSN